MGQRVGKFIYGSQNYYLDTWSSDKDYKLVEVPDWEDLFHNVSLNRQVDENVSVWDIRSFCNYLLKASPNAIELLFSVDQTYWDEDFDKLLDFVREHVMSIIRVNWKNFARALTGMAWGGIDKNGKTPKTVARLIYFYNFSYRVFFDQKVDYSPFDWAARVRALSELTKEEEQDVRYIKDNWDIEEREMDFTEEDKKNCEEIEKRFQAYMANYLTHY